MEITCPSCGCALELPEGIVDGCHLQCTECDAKFEINNGEATLLAFKLRPKAIICDGPQTRRKAVDFYTLTSEEERRNYAWRRWTARVIDFYCGFVFVSVPYSFLVVLSGKTGVGLWFWEWIAQPQNVWADYVLTTLLAYFSSVIIYAALGTTLGKKMCGLLVADQCGNRMSFGAYFVREMRVIFYGEWLCIPLLTVIGWINQYHYVVQTGRASYDDKWINADFYSRPTRGKRGFDSVLVVLVLIVGAVLRQLLK